LPINQEAYNDVVMMSLTTIHLPSSIKLEMRKILRNFTLSLLQLKAVMNAA